MPPPDPTTTVDTGSLAAVLIGLGEIKTDLAVVKTKLEAVPDHEQRIRSLERFRFTIAGAGALAGALAAWLITYLQNIHH